MLDLDVEIVRSGRRKRTAQAQIREGRLRILIPDHLSATEESRLVEEMKARMARKMSTVEVDLRSRADQLARRYGLPRPSSIEWSDRQNLRWGSCSPEKCRVLISSRLATVPGWVLDSVLVHELAHLVEANHGPRFQALVEKYPLTERARGYLIAKSEASEPGLTDRGDPGAET